MKGVIQAKKKPIQRLTLADLGISADEVGAKGARVKGESLVLPEPRQAGKIIEGEPAEATVELVRLLREEAKVL